MHLSCSNYYWTCEQKRETMAPLSHTYTQLLCFWSEMPRIPVVLNYSVIRISNETIARLQVHVERIKSQPYFSSRCTHTYHWVGVLWFNISYHSHTCVRSCHAPANCCRNCLQLPTAECTAPTCEYHADPALKYSAPVQWAPRNWIRYSDPGQRTSAHANVTVACRCTLGSGNGAPGADTRLSRCIRDCDAIAPDRTHIIIHHIDMWLSIECIFKWLGGSNVARDPSCTPFQLFWRAVRQCYKIIAHVDWCVPVVGRNIYMGGRGAGIGWLVMAAQLVNQKPNERFFF